MITIERIIAFITKAMAEGFIVDIGNNSIDVYNTKNNSVCSFCSFYIIINNDDYSVLIRNDGEINIKITEADYHELIVLKDRIKKYREEKALEEFNNFFKYENKPADINDLDEED